MDYEMISAALNGKHTGGKSDRPEAWWRRHLLPSGDVAGNQATHYIEKKVEVKEEEEEEEEEKEEEEEEDVDDVIGSTWRH